MKQTLELLTRLLAKQRFWFYLLLFPTPLLFIWPKLFLEIEWTLVNLPLSFWLHEFLHIILLPRSTQIEITSQETAIQISISKQSLSPWRALFIAVTPGSLLFLLGMAIYPNIGFPAIPFTLHILTVVTDISAWFGGMHNASAGT